MKHKGARIALKNDIEKVRDDVAACQKTEIDALRLLVQSATANANQNNDNIFASYDEKMKKIKDVCA